MTIFHGSGETEIGNSFWRRWRGMKNRCLNHHCLDFGSYGGRGVQVVDKWVSFDGFMVDMWESFQEHVAKFGLKNTSLDRIDVNGNYSKENCRWATWKEQQKNRREKIKGTPNLVSFRGEKMSVQRLSFLTGIKTHTLFYRIRAKGLTPEEAVVAENKTKFIYFYKGKNYSLTQLASLAGFAPRVLKRRFQRLHWPVEKAVETPIQIQFRH